MMKSRQAGFTLIEVLIAMFIFSLISVGATSALTSSIRGKAQMNERLSAINEIEMARAIMRSDFSQITLRPSRDAYGSPVPYVMSGGVEDLINFTRTGRINPGGLEPRSEFQRVSYVFENGNLVRRSLAQSNPAPQTKTRDRILLRNLETVDMRFHIGPGKSGKSGPSDNIARPVTSQSPLYPQSAILIKPDQDIDLPKMMSLDIVFKNGAALTQYFEVIL